MTKPTCCFHCQRYRHVANACKSKKTVCLRISRPRCAGYHDGQKTCKATPDCAARGGDHEASDSICVVWTEECVISKLHKNKKICYRDAVTQREIDNRTRRNPVKGTKRQKQAADCNQNKRQDYDRRNKEEARREDRRTQEEGRIVQ